MIWLVYVASAVAAYLLLAWAHTRYWIRRLSRSQPYVETHRVATPDGNAFELRRIPRVGPATSEPPVLMVHGIAVNHRNVDAWGDWSLARRVAQEGRDVWLLTLRCGRADLSRGELRTCTFQAMAEQDVPLAVAEVLQRTGAQSLDYVGFSMGGILLYAALGRSLPETQLRRAVVIGSPATIKAPFLAPRWARGWPLPSVPLRRWSHLFAFLGEWRDTPITRIFLNLANTEPGLTRHLMVDGAQSIPGPLLTELSHMAWNGGTLLMRARPALDGLRGVKVPVHFIVAAGDRLGKPTYLQPAYDAWGADSGASKRWTLFGRAQGHAADYGHVDLMLGKRAPQEVFPPIVDFLCAAAA